MEIDVSTLEQSLEAARAEHRVPGMSAAVFADGELRLASTGITNLTTGVPMTNDTIAHIGSITKIFNATLVMQLVDEGKLALERPVAEYLPEFRLGDSGAARSITVEQLLNHTSGIDANLLPDSGHDNETIENAMVQFATVRQLHAPGAARSYCNAGTVIAGYLCQRITGTSWYDLVKRRIFAPLGMEHAAVLPEDALLHRPSVGHFLNRTNGEMVRTTHTFLPLSFAPAGSTAMMSAEALMTFLRAHMADGVGPNGARILSQENAQRMRPLSGDVKGPSCFEGGIGWMLLGRDFVHHGGGGPGIISWFLAHPESQTIVVVLTNAEQGFAAANAVMGPFIESRFGIVPFPSAKPAPETPFDPAAYVGIYENYSTAHEIKARDGRLFWRPRARARYYDNSPMEKAVERALVPTASGSFLTDTSDADEKYPSTVALGFAAPDARGRMEYLIYSYRMHRRRDRGRGV
jgi:CubicO group peptidase (beta-lactamase class C family)